MLLRIVKKQVRMKIRQTHAVQTIENYMKYMKYKRAALKQLFHY